MIKKITINAPSKINIGLNIINKREDGFHNLKTIFFPLYDPCDKIIIEPALSFSFSSTNPDLATPTDNIICKAIDLLKSITQKVFPVSVELIKRIPVGAGLGGGSSDAAAILVAFNDMFGLGFNEDQLKELALRLGSDVPFFIKPFPAYAEGRGEQLQRVDLRLVEGFILLVNPNIHISTKEAFDNITPQKNDVNLVEVLKSKDYSLIKKNITNDFEEYVFNKYPSIGEIKSKMYDKGAKFALMSGSGSSVFGIFPDEESASEASRSLNSEYFKVITDINY